ncbi:glycoside hydrolase family 19 protein [Mesorhizobium sp.]|uniref:glycoside hydrolase family 19 protein n=1 Tax=Mesorhizobium sp. TaxID=1871066 RepID=UPI0011F96964|nr:glycoside hydrolase family 19 protein [Mesorhizobium sp.]TIQ96705.1 MAG: glycoside hydrolase family 19 protein [Mesorhizobium sp.]
MANTLAADLARLSPTASPAIIAGIAVNAHLLDQAGINTPIRLRHFFARVCVETGGLRSLEENLSYSAERLTRVWPKRFPSLAVAKPFAKNPAKLAEKVYGGRLGNFKPGDGWNFRGSGLLQNTGRENFEEVEDETGLPVTSQPELLRTFPGALQAATIYWTKRKINALADQDDVTGVCKGVNGGTIGLSEQKTWLAKAAKIWPAGSAIDFTTPILLNVDRPGSSLPVQPAQPAGPVLQPQPPPSTNPANLPISEPPSAPSESAPQPVRNQGVQGDVGAQNGKTIRTTPKIPALATILALAAMALAGFWHHVTDLFWSIFG